MFTYDIKTAHGESSFSVSRYHEYGSLSSSAIDKDNLGFREVIYDVASPHFEAHNQLAHHHYPIDEKPNMEVQAFYDLLQ